MLQFLAPGPQQTQHINFFLDYFGPVCRYQDDTWFGDGTHAEKAKYEDQFWGILAQNTIAVADTSHPFHGIYPSHLVIKTEQCSRHQVDYLDVLITNVLVRRGTGNTGFSGGTSSSTWKLKTSVYKKRSEPAYKDIPMVVYPHKDTMLTKQCKYGIVYSQAHRFMRRCTFRSI